MTPETCSHGKYWTSECEECNGVIAAIECRDLIRDCDRVTSYLSDKPAMASDPSVVIDLYHTVSRLAKVLCNALGKNEVRSGD
jgi:hypothetical protein